MGIPEVKEEIDGWQGGKRACLAKHLVSSCTNPYEQQ
jgi:hypothetical protein